jgi:hypothetical protein
MTGTTGRTRTRKDREEHDNVPDPAPVPTAASYFSQGGLQLLWMTTTVTQGKRKPNNDEGMTRDDQGGRARTSGATDPTTMGMVMTQGDKGHENDEADYQD